MTTEQLKKTVNNFAMKRVLKRSIVLMMAAVFGLGQLARADEGMWILPLIGKLNLADMQKKGFKLSADDIYSINQSSMKDAIVIFGNGCTGELISDQGLILTNHHCGYEDIQSLSTMEHNYLEDGFWARSQDEEIAAPGLTVTFLKRMEDVTAKVLQDVTPDLNESQRQAVISANARSIEKEAIDSTHYTAIVKPFFGGNQYFLMVYEVFKDIRFVGAPPSSIGKFGHDTDNWMWPRHTGDFSMFRVYADANGKPADYLGSNKPLKPAHHLPVSIKGYQPDDFAMTLGNPGSTDRYLSSWGINERMNIVNHSRIKPRGIKQDIWMADMQANEKIKLQYASKYARSSNYWKNSIGMNLGLTKLNVPDQKRALEAQFDAWVKSSPEKTAKYGLVLDSLKFAYADRSSLIMARSFLIECLLRGAELPYFAYAANELKSALEKKDQAAIDKAVEKLRQTGIEFFKDYSPSTDQKVLAALGKLYMNDIEATYHPTFFNGVKKQFKGNFEKYSAELFRRSLFGNQARFEAFLNKPSLKQLNADAAFVAGNSMMETYRTIVNQLTSDNNKVERYCRLFQAGLIEMQPEKTFSPDANFTMRMSYGTVGGYDARDAVYYKHFTTLEGVMEKEDSTNWEFVVPAKLKELYKSADYGRYADDNGVLRVCFTTNNDITGGNSGSPVINGKGELIGLAFDGNWEAMSGDIAFEHKLQKCINVDIRYVLFIIDKYAGATNLIDEMTIR